MKWSVRIKIYLNKYKLLENINTSGYEYMCI